MRLPQREIKPGSPIVKICCPGEFNFNENSCGSSLISLENTCTGIHCTYTRYIFCHSITSCLPFNSISKCPSGLCCHQRRKLIPVLISPRDVPTTLCKVCGGRYGFSNILQSGYVANGNPYTPQKGTRLGK